MNKWAREKQQVRGQDGSEDANRDNHLKQKYNDGKKR